MKSLNRIILKYQAWVTLFKKNYRPRIKFQTELMHQFKNKNNNKKAAIKIMKLKMKMIKLCLNHVMEKIIMYK
jgi:hypothetical protein